RANRSIERAICGRYSLIRIPGTEVAVSLIGPPLAWPGFKSNVSRWLGPPFIQSKMQERLGFPWRATSAASVSIQPEAEPPKTPAAESRSKSRRETSVMAIGRALGLDAWGLHSPA